MKIAKILRIVSLLIISGFMLGNTQYSFNNDFFNEAIILKASTEIDNDSFVRGNYKKFIIITWDGTRARWLREYSDNGMLPIVQRMRSEGGEVSLGLGNTHSATDCCLATIETGVGPLVNTIIANQFSPSSPKRRIPDGMQTSERLKEFLGDEFKTGHINSWQHHEMNNDLFGLPDGHITQDIMLDSIFLNAIPGEDVDFWFGSENLSWIPEEPQNHRASWDEHWYGKWIDDTPEEGLLPTNYPDIPSSYGYIERYSTTFRQDVGYWKSPLINAQFLAEKASEFIDQYHEDDFYLRIHMTEPDKIGHSYSESEEGSYFNTITPEYLLALQECDTATGKIIQSLIENGISDDTLVIVGADHSFLGTSHSEEPICYVGNKKVWGYSGENNTDINGILHNIQPTVLSIAGVENWTNIDYYQPKLLYNDTMVSYYTPPAPESTATTEITIVLESSIESTSVSAQTTSFSSFSIIILALAWIYTIFRKEKKYVK